MKITILKGSPHKNGASNKIVNSFIKGAEEKGHECSILDIPRMNLHPCLGCIKDGGDCIQKDDGHILKEEILSSDMVVFATPVYFYDMSAQLKIALDRFHCFYSDLKDKKIKSVLIATVCREDDEVMKYLSNLYSGIARYLNFENCGEILAVGCGYSNIDENSKYLSEAYNLGKKL